RLGGLCRVLRRAPRRPLPAPRQGRLQPRGGARGPRRRGRRRQLVMAVADASTGLEVGLALTALGLGFRHGIDWDHIAALTDITGSQESGRRSMVLATMYALGHALVVLVLGVVAIALSAEIPHWLDEAMSRVVGFTLVP